MIFTPEEIHDAWWRIYNSEIISFSNKHQGIKNYYIRASKLNNIEDIVKMFYPGIQSLERDRFLNLLKLEYIKKYNKDFIEYLK